MTVERIDDGEVSPYLTGERGVGDELELRGPIGGYFTWRARGGGPLLLIAGGSGLKNGTSQRFDGAIRTSRPITHADSAH